MPYKLSSSEPNIVANLRQEYGQQIANYSDACVAHAWRGFAQSDEYPDTKNAPVFPEWCEMYADEDGRIES